MAIPLSVRRLVATMSVDGVNVVEFCAAHQMSRDTFYRIRRQYEAEGDVAFEPGSRAPKRIRNKTPIEVEDRVVELRKQLGDDGLDAGPATIQWHLEQGAETMAPSVSTIYRILRARGFVTPDPKKTPTKYGTFQAERANELWQIDGTDFTLAGGEVIKIINVIDDASRVCIGSQAHSGETLRGSWATLISGATRWGLPERLLSDNGRSFKALEEPLAAIGVSVTRARPYHPQTCGKVERFHKTQAQWLDARPQPDTLGELQQLLDRFAVIYNEKRPHRGIARRTPASRWNDLPKSGPADRPLDLNGHHIVNRKVATNGWFRFDKNLIAAGKHLTGETVTVIATGPNVHVFHHTNLIREITLKPRKHNYPVHARRGRPTQSTK